ncbi:UPF0481 protein At3g47200-like [Magnolia sinica]|uniref:UPF0481 protein At3g47200-like n=1 Tax=Magnolia sinica TaxID=86752 RepID=UPI00265A6727|nr:UPF0481 protein At3g47200-like [Magnolia sinica]
MVEHQILFMQESTVDNEEKANQGVQPHVPTDATRASSLAHKLLINPQLQKESWIINISCPTHRVPNSFPPYGREANQGENPPVPILHDDLDPTWVSLLEQKLLIDQQPDRKLSSCSIHKVPTCFHKGDETAYVPQIISIGPIHRTKKSLQAMEEHKRKYLHDIISLTKTNSEDSASNIFKRFLTAVKSVEKMAWECYSESIDDDLNSNAFVEMMVIDGCFIIGLLCKAARLINVDGEDPIFKMSWLLSRLRNDLLMLENQIPFIILDCLFNLMNIVRGPNRPSLAHLALDFFQGLVPQKSTRWAMKEKSEYKHLLHLFHSSLLPAVKEDKQSERNACFKLIVSWINVFKKSGNKEKDNEMEANHLNLIHSVTALKEAGIGFKKGKADSFFDVKFKNGTMEIPTFVIHGATYSLFLNLIAFEQCYTDCSKHITAYTAFMNCLINSAKDVETLRHCGVIENWLGSNDEHVACRFKMLSREVAIPTGRSYLSDVFWAVSRFRRTKWEECKESLKRYHFNSRWAIFPFAAGIFVLVFTFMQTIPTVNSFFHHSS